eukprot:760472-Hanusia_phi.AAC.1
MLDKDNFYYKQSNANLKRRLRELTAGKRGGGGGGGGGSSDTAGSWRKRAGRDEEAAGGGGEDEGTVRVCAGKGGVDEGETETRVWRRSSQTSRISFRRLCLEQLLCACPGLRILLVAQLSLTPLLQAGTSSPYCSGCCRAPSVSAAPQVEPNAALPPPRAP